MQAAELKADGAYNEDRSLLLRKAVHNHKAISKKGMLERIFTLMFRGFVYPQIWEDPEIDLEALKIGPSDRIMTIASGGCNVMNYLTEDPKAVIAVDLNPAHIALTRLKLAAIRHLPDYETFFKFFGHADEKENTKNYDLYLRDRLDEGTRKFWEARTPLRGRRINYFTKNLYQYGLLGRFIGTVHLLAKIYGQDPREILTARTMEEQRALFEKTLAPIFDKKMVRALCKTPVSLYGLGIPPAQYESLALSANGDMAQLLRERLEKLACDFPIEENYFAWQAFGRGYDRKKRLAVPRYLREENYTKLKERENRVETHHTTLTEYLGKQPEQSLDSYVFLDAQDWMNAAQLTELWSEILRTAAPGARVIFRTAGEESILPGAIPDSLLDRWSYDREQCISLSDRDRSSIYGGFHLYTLKG